MGLSSRKYELVSLTTFTLAWVVLFVLVWPSWHGGAPGLRVAMALFIFLLPGVAASMVLIGDHFTLLMHVTGGTALSVFFVSVLGLLGRVAHFPFSYIKPVFAVGGIICLAVVLRQAQLGKALHKPLHLRPLNLLILPCLIAAGIALSLLDRFAADDFRYLVYITSWQHAPQLNFNMVTAEVAVADRVRFWLAMFPMNLALLSELSRVSGLLLTGLYLEPFLVPLAILAMYSFYEALLESGTRALAACIAQFGLLLLLAGGSVQRMGNVFFYRLTEDKAFAAFIVVPAFFLAMLELVRHRGARSGLYATLIGLALSLTHPIMLAYAVFVAGAAILADALARRQYRALGLAALVLSLVILSSAWLRWVPNSRVTYSAEAAAETPDANARIHFLEGTPFYGFNLQTIRIAGGTADPQTPWQFFLANSYLWILGLGLLWSLLHLRSHPLVAGFVGGASLLVALCAIPYTGWLVGIFVSSRMLWRSAWFLPAGCIVVLIAESAQAAVRLGLRGKTKRLNQAAPLASIALLTLVLIAIQGGRVFQARWRGPQQLTNYRQQLQELTALGNFLERKVRQPARFAAPAAILDYLPGVASTAKSVTSYHNVPRPDPADKNQVALLFSPDDQVSLEQRMAIIKKYRIQYLVISSGNLLRVYDAAAGTERVGAVSGYWVLHFVQMDP